MCLLTATVAAAASKRPIGQTSRKIKKLNNSVRSSRIRHSIMDYLSPTSIHHSLFPSSRSTTNLQVPGCSDSDGPRERRRSTCSTVTPYSAGSLGVGVELTASRSTSALSEPRSDGRRRGSSFLGIPDKIAEMVSGHSKTDTTTSTSSAVTTGCTLSAVAQQALTRQFENRSAQVLSAASRRHQSSHVGRLADDAGFLALKPSDLVFRTSCSNHGTQNVEYFTSIVSCRPAVVNGGRCWNLYLLLLDDHTNVEHFETSLNISNDVFDQYALSGSPLTLAAMALLLWQDLLANQRLLVLLDDSPFPLTADPDADVIWRVIAQFAAKIQCQYHMHISRPNMSSTKRSLSPSYAHSSSTMYKRLLFSNETPTTKTVRVADWLRLRRMLNFDWFGRLTFCCEWYSE